MIYLFDWGNTLMVDYQDENGPMYRWSKVTPIPNAQVVLQALCPHHNCYLATNARDSTKDQIHQALQRVDLDRYLTDIFCYQEIGYPKPSREYFDFIVNRLSVTPKDILMVGDSPDKDYLWAIENGAQAILYDPKDIHESRAFRKIHNLLELML